MIGEVFIRFASMTNGESYFAGMAVTPRRSGWWTIIRFEEGEVLDMAKSNTAQPTNPFHPGEILLEEFLQQGKITQAAFARRIGWTKHGSTNLCVASEV